MIKCRGMALCGFLYDCPFKDNCNDEEALEMWYHMSDEERQAIFEELTYGSSPGG